MKIIDTLRLPVFSSDTWIKLYAEILIALGLWSPEKGYRIEKEEPKTIVEDQPSYLTWYETTEEAQEKLPDERTPEEKKAVAAREAIEEEGYVVTPAGVWKSRGGGAGEAPMMI